MRAINHTITMRSVSNTYLIQASDVLCKQNLYLSHRRLRRLAYLDVYLQSYKQFSLYNKYKSLVNNDASKNQTLVLGIVVAIISSLLFLIYKINFS
jgi:hypothetical protein